MTLTQLFVEDEAKQGIAKVFESTARIAPVLPVEKMEGLIFKGGKEVALGDISRRTVNKTPPATRGSTVIPMEEKVVIATSKVTTDHRMGEAPRASEIARRVRNMSRWWDNEIINGDASVDPEQLSGLKVRCAGNQLITAGANGAVLTLDLFNALIDAVEDMGGGRYVFTNKTIARKLKNLILAQAGGATVADVTGDAFNYEGWTIVPLDRKHDNTPVLPMTDVQGTSGATTTSMYALSVSPDEKVGVKLLMASNSVEVIDEGFRDLQHIDYVELAFGLAVYDDRALARMKGVKAA